MSRTNLDIDILRTLVTTQQLGGFNRAAKRVGRSQSAVSQQIRRLEEQLGRRLFRKEGRTRALTEAGDVMLSYARRILDLNDQAVAAIRGIAVGGSVRFGLQTDLASCIYQPEYSRHLGSRRCRTRYYPAYCHRDTEIA